MWIIQDIIIQDRIIQDKCSPQTRTFVHEVFEMIRANVIELQLFWLFVIQITPFDIIDPFFDSAKINTVW